MAPAPEQPLDPQPGGDVVHPLHDSLVRQAVVLATEGDLTGDLVGEEQAARILEHTADQSAAFPGRQPRELIVPQQDPPAQGARVEVGQEPVDQAGQGRLAAAGGPGEDDDLARFDLQGHLDDADVGIRFVGEGDRVEYYRSAHAG